MGENHARNFYARDVVILNGNVCKLARTSFLRNHLGLPLGFENTHSKTTFLSFPSLTVWSIKGFMKLSCFCSLYHRRRDQGASPENGKK